jgi:hypothetical protein
VTILAGPGGFNGSLANIDVSGGAGGSGGGGAGGEDVIRFAIPEPTSLVPIGTGVLFLLGVGLMRRQVRTPATRNP